MPHASRYYSGYELHLRVRHDQLHESQGHLLGVRSLPFRVQRADRAFFNSMKNERAHETRYATGRKPRQSCSTASNRSTTGNAAIPPLATYRRFSSCNPGSAISIRKNWQHETHQMEDGKQRKIHRNSISRNVCQSPAQAGSGQHEFWVVGKHIAV